jgi:hypothetical protein
VSGELESLVRPFQTGEITPAQTYYQPGQIGVPNVILRIGRSASGKVLQGNYNFTETHYMTKYETERKTPLAGAHHSQFVGKFGQGIIGSPMGSSVPGR